MYIEEEYIREQFTSNFLNNQHGKIVIYGTGIHTQRLLEHVHDSRIVGLMDVKKTGQKLWGYRVLSYEDVAGLRALSTEFSIVIIARNAVIMVIYRRIEEFCRKHHINVFDIHGNNLHDNLPEDKYRECFCLSEQTLQKEIQSADIVTFDIFDTLLTRCIMRPRDIFSVIDVCINSGNDGLNEKNYCFFRERIKAEENFPLGSNPSINEIYQQFQKNTGVSDEELHYLLEMEIAVEKRFLVRRERMCELLEMAVRQGKEVYLISDMYFSKEILEEIVNDFHICGYKDLYVSCACKVSKQEGLFEYFKNAAHIDTDEKRCLHIGDNYFSDIIASKRAGFHAFQIYSTIEMLENSIYAKGLSYCRSLEENIVLSYFAAHAYNNPFCECRENGKLLLHSSESIIRLFIAPVMFKYMIWLVQNILKNQHDLVIFPSRDGYLLKKIYHLIHEKTGISLPESVYFYTSRRAALVAAVRNRKDVEDILKLDYAKDMRNCLKDRFDLIVDGDESLEKISEGNLESVINFEDILEKCREAHEGYSRYIHEIGLEQYENPAILDFVAMGTVQEALQRIMDKPFMGYYFLRRCADKQCLEELCSYSLYSAAGDFQITANLYQYYYFLEAILTSYEPTFRGVSNEGEMLFYPERRNEKTIELLRRIHNEILTVCGELIDLFPDIMYADSPVDLYDFLLGLFSSDYSDSDNEELLLLENTDEFMGRKMSEINR